MQHIPLSVRIKAFFARDKYTFWWNHFTDEEKKLRRMDVWELAKVINDARVRNLAGEAEKLIVAEHLLNVRLAEIQARPTYISVVAGIVGIVGGAFLTTALQKPNDQPKFVCECQHGDSIQQNMNTPIQSPVPSVVKPGMPESKSVKNASQPSAKSKP